MSVHSFGRKSRASDSDCAQRRLPEKQRKRSRSNLAFTRNQNTRSVSLRDEVLADDGKVPYPCELILDRLRTGSRVFGQCAEGRGGFQTKGDGGGPVQGLLVRSGQTKRSRGQRQGRRTPGKGRLTAEMVSERVW